MNQLKMDKKYYKKLWSVALILLGAYLIIEHILVWGQLDFMDFWGHEWLGFILILI